MTASGGGPAALERLAIALGPGFATTLVTGSGHRPRLSVVSRDTRAGEDVYADENGWFWWPGACAARRWCAVRRWGSKEVQDLLAGLSQQPGGS